MRVPEIQPLTGLRALLALWVVCQDFVRELWQRPLDVGIYVVLLLPVSLLAHRWIEVPLQKFLTRVQFQRVVSTVALMIAAMVMFACSGRSVSPGKMVDGRQDAGRSPVIDAGSLTVRDSGAELDADTTHPVVGCPMGVAIAPLTYVPSKILVLRHVTAPCSPVDTVFLLRNPGASSVEIESLEVSPASFSLAAGELPKRLEPGRSVPVRVSFNSTSVDRVPGAVVANTSAGCAEIPIEGQMVTQSMMVPSVMAFDFGASAVGETTKPAELTVFVQGEELPGDRKKIEGFAGSPTGVFDVVSQPKSLVELGSCDSATISMSFTAPAQPGAIEGSVSWGFVSGMYFGEQAIPVFGTSLPK